MTAPTGDYTFSFADQPIDTQWSTSDHADWTIINSDPQITADGLEPRSTGLRAKVCYTGQSMDYSGTISSSLEVSTPPSWHDPYGPCLFNPSTGVGYRMRINYNIIAISRDSNLDSSSSTVFYGMGETMSPAPAAGDTFTLKLTPAGRLSWEHNGVEKKAETGHTTYFSGLVPSVYMIKGNTQAQTISSFACSGVDAAAAFTIDDVNTTNIVTQSGTITINGDFSATTITAAYCKQPGAASKTLSISSQNDTTVVCSGFDIHTTEINGIVAGTIELTDSTETYDKAVTFSYGAGKATQVLNSVSAYGALKDTAVATAFDVLEYNTTLEGSTITMGDDGEYESNPALGSGEVDTWWLYDVSAKAHISVSVSTRGIVEHWTTTFTQSDGDLVSPWVTSNIHAQVLSNALGSIISGDRRSFYPTITSRAQWAEIETTVLPTGSDTTSPTIYQRAGSTYRAEAITSSSGIYLWWQDGSSHNTGTYSHTLAIGDKVRIEGYDDGSSYVKVFLNDEMIIKQVITSLTTGSPGITQYNPQGASSVVRADNFRTGTYEQLVNSPTITDVNTTNVVTTGSSITINGTYLTDVISAKLKQIGKADVTLSIGTPTATQIICTAVDLHGTEIDMTEGGSLQVSTATESINKIITYSYATGRSSIVLTSISQSGVCKDVVGAAAGDILEYPDTVSGLTVTAYADGTYTLNGSAPINSSDTWYLYDVTGYSHTSIPVYYNPGGVQFEDDFNRADGALTSPWTTFQSYPVEIIGQEVGSTYHPSTSRGSYIDTISARGQWAELEVKVISDSDSNNCSPDIMMNPINGSRYDAAVKPGWIYIWARKDDGSHGQISSTYNHTLAVGDRVRIECYDDSDDIKVFLNDSLIITQSDADLQVGHPGINIWAPTNQQVRMDNFKAGDFGEVATIVLGNVNGNNVVTTDESITINGTYIDTITGAVLKQVGKNDVTLSLGTPTSTSVIATAIDLHSTQLDATTGGLLEITDGTQISSVSISYSYGIGRATQVLTAPSATGATKDIGTAVAGDILEYPVEMGLGPSVVTVETDGDFNISPAVLENTYSTWYLYDVSTKTHTLMNLEVDQIGADDVAFQDSFNRVDGELTDPWSNFQTYGATITGNELAGTYPGEGRRSYLPLLTGRSQWAELTITSIVSGADHISPCILMDPDTGYRYEAITTSDSIQILVVGPNGSSFLGIPYSHTLIVGDTIRFESFDYNDDLKVYLNNSLVITETNADLLNGHPGVCMYEASGTPTGGADNFRAGGYIVPPAVGPIFEDDFNRADETVLQPPWQTVSSKQSLSLSSNEIKGTNINTSYVNYVTSVQGRGQWAEVEVTSLSNIDDNLSPNILTDTVIGYRYQVEINRTFLRMWASTPTNSDFWLSNEIPYTLQIGDVVRIESYTDSDDIAAFVNGIEVSRVTHSELTTGYPSISAWQPSGTAGRVDNFACGTVINTWDFTSVNISNQVYSNQPIYLHGTLMEAVLAATLKQPGKADVPLTILSKTESTITCSSLNLYNTQIVAGSATVEATDYASTDSVSININSAEGISSVTLTSISPDGVLGNVGSASIGDVLEYPATLAGSAITVDASGEYTAVPPLANGTFDTWYLYRQATTDWLAVQFAVITADTGRRIVFEDDFTRADGVVGPPWVTTINKNPLPLTDNTIKGAQVDSTSSSGHITAVSGRGQWAEVVIITPPPGGSNDNISPQVLTDPSNGYRYEATCLDDQIGIYMQGPSNITLAITDHALVSGQVVRIECYEDSDDIVVFVDDEEVLRATDATLQIGHPGINAWQPGGGYVAAVDYFKCGTFGGIPLSSVNGDGIIHHMQPIIIYGDFSQSTITSVILNQLGAAPINIPFIQTSSTLTTAAIDYHTANLFEEGLTISVSDGTDSNSIAATVSYSSNFNSVTATAISPLGLFRSIEEAVVGDIAHIDYTIGGSTITMDPAGLLAVFNPRVPDGTSMTWWFGDISNHTWTRVPVAISTTNPGTTERWTSLSSGTVRNVKFYF